VPIEAEQVAEILQTVRDRIPFEIGKQHSISEEHIGEIMRRSIGKRYKETEGQHPKPYPNLYPYPEPYKKLAF
jgi:hypothetical protein